MVQTPLTAATEAKAEALDFTSLMAKSSSMEQQSFLMNSFTSSPTSNAATATATHKMLNQNEHNNPSIKRSLDSLSIAANAFSKSLTSATQDEANAYKLLAARGTTQNTGFDVMKLEDETRELESLALKQNMKKIKQDLTHPRKASEMSLEWHLQELNTRMIERICTETQRVLTDDYEALVEQSLHDEYKSERDTLLNGLSGRITVNIMQNKKHEPLYFIPPGVESFGNILQKTRQAPTLAQALSQYSGVFRSNVHLEHSATATAALDLLSSMLIAATSTTTHDTSSGLAFGALQYFTSQFKSFVENKLLQQNISPPSTFLDQLALYLDLLNQTSSSQVSIWQTLYYCLRCGDADSAYKVYQKSTQQESSILEVLKHLSTIQTSKHYTLFHTVQQLHSFIPPHLLQPLELLYHSCKARTSNHYQQAVLALLSFQPLPSELLLTIEDYLFSHLWTFCISPTDIQILKSLQEKITFWGQAHFESENNGGWGYAIPLLVSQQFQSALLHLVDSGYFSSLLYSTHFALIFQYAKISLSNYLLDEKTSSNDFIARLIMTYIQQWQTYNPELALEYIICIPGEQNTKISKNVKHQIINLLSTVSKDQLELLVGSMKDSQRLTNGVLDSHFSPDQVSNILYETARYQIENGNEKQALVWQLLCLSENNNAILEYLNHHLGDYLFVLPDHEEEVKQRLYWKDLATQFYNTNIHNNRFAFNTTFNENPAQACFSLLQLMAFFDSIQTKQYSHAWNVLRSLNLFDEIQNLDQNIQKNLGNILLGGMEALQHLYSQFKQENRHEFIHDVMVNAKRLVNVAGNMITSGSDVKDREVYSRIARMEALMMS